MTGRDIVVIGASAGGVGALLQLAQKLPAHLDAAIFVVLHTSPSSPGVLPMLFNRAGPLPASFARDGEKIEAGRIYVAPPDLHMLIRDHAVRVTHGPKENAFRPAIDPLFRTAARNFGKRVIGIVLSGSLDDGTDGLRIIKEHDGIAIAQDPEEADFPSMPASAIQNVDVDHVVKLADIPALLVQYSQEKLEEVPMSSDDESPDVVDHGDHGLEGHSVPGSPSSLTCPECGGALWQKQLGRQLQFRCHVGHIYTGDGLVAEADRNLEQALWSAVRVMEETAELRRRMASVSENAKWKKFAPPYEQQANDLEERAAIIRNVLQSDFRTIDTRAPDLRKVEKVKGQSTGRNVTKKTPR